jgi:hypothetical protein
MMIETITRKGTTMIHDKIGYGFNGTRKDGRKFAGVIQDVRIVKDRTLVVIRQDDNAHKSFYVEDMCGWSASLCNGQPVYTNA